MTRKKLKIHNPSFVNQTGYIRNYHLFWDMLIYELEKEYDIQEYRYEGKKHPVRVELDGKTGDGFCFYDSDMIIENDKNEFIIFTVTDAIHKNMLEERYNPNCKKVFISQHPTEYIKANVNDDIIYCKKYSPWIYFPYSTINLEPFFHKRKRLTSLVDKMIFRGGVDHRKIINYFTEDVLTGTAFSKSESEYCEEVIQHKIGLSIGGVGEICYRDIEYMAMGVPFLRFTYQSKLLPELIPNFHYIAVPPPPNLPVDTHRNNMPDDSRGEKEHAELLIKRFLEVKDDVQFLNFISKNARNYYETFLAPNKNVDYTIKLIKQNLFNI